MKKRLDSLVAQRGLVESRERAKAFIIAGNISVDGETVRTPSIQVEEASQISLKLKRGGYVSRGGVKLEKALRVFSIEATDSRCIDIGASTGGFTECLLKHGAAWVLAVDVGKNQLALKLRQDPRVEVVEGFNARFIDRLDLEIVPDIVTIDVSFISIRLIVKPLYSMMGNDSSLVVLIKPQFELDKPYPGFRGVVRGRQRHLELLHNLHDFFKSTGYIIRGCTHSPIKGPKGNIEYFMHLRILSSDNESAIDLEKLVDDSYTSFNEGG